MKLAINDAEKVLDTSLVQKPLSAIAIQRNLDGNIEQ